MVVLPGPRRRQSRRGDPGYAAGETIRVHIDFSEAMTVTGSPYLVLDLAGVPRKAKYKSTAGMRYLVFTYEPDAADFDCNSVSICSNRALDAGCGRITLADGSIRASSDSAVPELDLPELGNHVGNRVNDRPEFIPAPGSGAPTPNLTTATVRAA